MATVSDSLETILRLVNLGIYVRGFEMIAGSIERATETYANFEAAQVRAEFSMHEFGQSMPTVELEAFGRQLSLTTGQTQSDIAGLEAYLARFRSSGDDIEHATQVIANAAQLANVPMEQLGHLIERARRGQARGLWDTLGIQVKGLEGQIYSLNQIIDIVDQHTHDFSATFGQTLPGEMRRASAAVDDLQIQLGRLFSGPAAVAIEAFTSVVHGLADAFQSLGAALGYAAPTTLGAAGNAAGGASSATNKTLDYLQKIAFNTGPQGALGKAIHGGGSFDEPGGGLPIRDFNLQYKRVR